MNLSIPPDVLRMFVLAIGCSATGGACINGYHLPEAPAHRVLLDLPPSSRVSLKELDFVPPVAEEPALVGLDGTMARNPSPGSITRFEVVHPAPTVGLAVPSDEPLPAPLAASASVMNFELPPRFHYGLPEEQRQVYETVVMAYEQRPAVERTPQSRADRAIALIYLGRHQEAIRELKVVEKLLGDYVTASALGTAYELAGNLRQARRWIAEGARRNPQGHEGSEWLHLAIIDAKRALHRDPRHLESGSVLRHAPSHPDEEIVRAIEYQLNERLTFITKDDPVVADLFYEAGARTTSPLKRALYFRESARFHPLRTAAIAAHPGR